MQISKERYFKDMAKALLRGWFAGLKEGNKKRLSRRQKGILKGKGAPSYLVVKKS